MAKYKIWLTVKDRYGTEKELDGGCINVDLSTLETDEVEAIDKHFATDAEMAQAVDKSGETIRYSGFEFNEDEEVGS